LRRRSPNLMKINNIIGIMETMAAVATIEKVHITEDGRHYFNENDAKHANGVTEKREKGKVTYTPNKVSYKSYARDAKELSDAYKAALEPAK
jgi:hypothetical protein